MRDSSGWKKQLAVTLIAAGYLLTEIGFVVALGGFLTWIVGSMPASAWAVLALSVVLAVHITWALDRARSLRGQPASMY